MIVLDDCTHEDEQRQSFCRRNCCVYVECQCHTSGQMPMESDHCMYTVIFSHICSVSVHPHRATRLYFVSVSPASLLHNCHGRRWFRRQCHGNVGTQLTRRWKSTPWHRRAGRKRRRAVFGPVCRRPRSAAGSRHHHSW